MPLLDDHRATLDALEQSQAEANQWKALAAMLVSRFGQTSGRDKVYRCGVGDLMAMAADPWELAVDTIGDKLEFRLSAPVEGPADPEPPPAASAPPG